jgi:hypothetical protein
VSEEYRKKEYDAAYEEEEEVRKKCHYHDDHVEVDTYLYTAHYNRLLLPLLSVKADAQKKEMWMMSQMMDG